MTQWQHFDWHEAEGVGTLTFRRPDKLNSLTYGVYRDLVRLTAQVAERRDLRVVVLTGQGKGFCSGGDVHAIIGDLLDRSIEDVGEFTRMTCAVVRNLRRMPQPVVAAINGTAAGAGAVIALASDFRLVAEHAKIHFLFHAVGLTGADMGAAWLLPRVVGEARAKEILFFGEGIPAAQALAWGLAHRAVPADELADVAQAWARRLADGPIDAVRTTKRAIHAEAEMSFEAALELEATAQAVLLSSGDHRAFYEAFKEKRPPRWPSSETGRSFLEAEE